jgi:DNA processing protein
MGRGLDDNEKLAWLRLARTENVGPVTFFQFIDHFKTAEKALEAIPTLAKRGGRTKPLKIPSQGEIEKEYAALKKIGGQIICACEELYPLALSAINDAPPVLSVLGNPALFNRPSVAIVGARNASLNGRKFAEKLARDLGAADQIIVSGLARGIDTSAHQGALESGTIAVVAGGIDIVYPPENQGLYEAITEKGLIVAESPFGQQPFAQSFPRRNRIVSGISQGTVIVEATLRSGSLITARLAGEQGRDVYAVPGHPLDPRAEGTNALIRDGAVLTRSAADILEHINGFTGRKTLSDSAFSRFPSPPEDGADLDIEPPQDARDTILSVLSLAPVGVDELARACHLTIAVLQVALLELELAGRIQRLHGNRVSLVD